MPSKKQILILIGVYILLFILSALITSAIVHITKNKVAPSISPISTQTPGPTPLRTDRSILLIGHGGAGHAGGGLADSMFVLQTEPTSKKLNIISIPRDIWVNGTKINEAFSKGGGEQAKKTVEQITGLTIDYFISVDFGGYKSAIDALGGIDVAVPASFEDKYYPVVGLENETCGFSAEEIEKFHQDYSGFELEKQFICRYETLKFETGTTHMDGTTALKFVRSRHSDTNGGDFARSQRQIAVLNAIKNKAISLQALNKLPEFFKQFSGLINTNIDPQVLEPTIQYLGNPEGYTIHNLILSTDNVFSESRTTSGSYILIPKNGEGAWGPVHEYIINQLQK